MKGVILAGGLGTRLHPLTKITNKHLLPVYDRPMVYYPIQTLINIGIEEKPAHPKSRFAVTGIYFYDGKVFDIVKTLKPSGRGELEITDVNNDYIARGAMSYHILEGWWSDAGTIESIYRAATLVHETGANRLDPA